MYKDLTAKETAKRLLEIENPAVYIHVHPDGDCVGSAAALVEIYRQLGRSACIIPEKAIPARLNFVLQRVGAEITNDSSGKSIIAIDVASPSQLGALAEREEKPILMIDHHEFGQKFADAYVVPKASSAAEALFDVAAELISDGKITLTEKLAYAMYTAISSDTGRFAYSNTTSRTLTVAARLLDTGIDSADINHRLFFSKTKTALMAEGFIISKIETFADGAVAAATLTLKELDSLEAKSEDFETAIDILRSLEGVSVALFIKEVSENTYKASFRSTGINVAEIAKSFGGGGHVRAAGCTIKADSIDEAKQLIVSAIPMPLN